MTDKIPEEFIDELERLIIHIFGSNGLIVVKKDLDNLVEKYDTRALIEKYNKGEK